MAAILGFGDYFGWEINSMTEYGWFSLSQSHSLSNLWDRAPERVRHGTHNQYNYNYITYSKVFYHTPKESG